MSESAINIYYWPMFGRAAHLMRMCLDAGVSYTHISEFPSLAGKLAAFGGNTGNFAPPLVEIDGKLVSQSAATALALGTHLGVCCFSAAFNLFTTRSSLLQQKLSCIRDSFF